MKRLTNQELKEIKGGASITGSLLNAFVDILKVLLDAGRSVGLVKGLAITFMVLVILILSPIVFSFGQAVGTNLSQLYCQISTSS